MSHSIDNSVTKPRYSGLMNMGSKKMGLWIFMGVMGAGAFVGIKRLRANPLLRAISANMDSYAEASRRGSVFLPEREAGDGFEPVEVLAARRVA